MVVKSVGFDGSKTPEYDFDQMYWLWGGSILSLYIMKGWLIIPVEYKGEQLEFRGKLLKGKGRYGYKVKVEVDGGEVVFEEEVDGRFKFTVLPGGIKEKDEIDVVLLETIIQVINEQ